MTTITLLGLTWLALYDNLFVKFVQGNPADMTAMAILSAVVQMFLAFVLIGLALSLVKMGYEHIQEARQTRGQTAGQPGDD